MVLCDMCIGNGHPHIIAGISNKNIVKECLAAFKYTINNNNTESLQTHSNSNTVYRFFFSRFSTHVMQNVFISRTPAKSSAMATRDAFYLCNSEALFRLAPSIILLLDASCQLWPFMCIILVSNILCVSIFCIRPLGFACEKLRVRI